MLHFHKDPRDRAVQIAIELNRRRPSLVGLWLDAGELLIRGSLGIDGLGKLRMLVFGSLPGR